MTIQEELQRLRNEARGLRQNYAATNRAWNQQKEKNGKLQNENSELKEKVTDLNKENQKLKDTIAKLIECKNKLAGMIFKPNLKPASKNQNLEKKKRGAQIGYIGYGRKTPKRIDQEKEIHLSHCPNCQNKLEQGDAFYERIIEDIQLPIKTIITKYKIQYPKTAVRSFFKVKIQNIIHSKYIYQDTQKIQTRIANQNENLITALLYDNVP